MKQWSLKSVFESHNYGQIIHGDFHDIFANWIKETFDSKIKIIDIGGSNGRVCLSINDLFYEYWSFDISEDNIETGKKHFQKDKRINFRLFDIDEEEIDIKCDAIYIDSVLTMIENPFDALIKFKKSSNYTFVNRTPFSEQTLKTDYMWGGMSDVSTLWKFDFDSFNSFCEKNNMKIITLTNSCFVIKNNN